MEFYPHRVAVGVVASATSASRTPSAIFMSNSLANAINTASVALNSVGQSGTSGISFTVTGPQGAQGTNGAKGRRGNNIYLLARSRSTSGTSPSSACLQIGGTGAVTYIAEPSTNNCLEDNSGFFYTTGSAGTTVTVTDLQVNSPIYSDSTCTTAYTGAIHNRTIRSDYFVVSAGLITTITLCGNAT